MAQGKVKWFNNQKGYGFITLDSGKDVFAHYSAIICDGFKALNANDAVTCDTEETDKGVKAINIKKIS